MIIYNLKLNKKIIFKILLISMILIALILTLLCFKDIIKKSNNSNKFFIDNNCENPNESNVIELDDKNYTNILKTVHENIDTYVGKEICYKGYVYRISNFTDDQFVLARDMDIGNNKTLIVGFLCSSDEAVNYFDNTWVEIKGVITKGTYNNSDIPIIKLNSIKEIQNFQGNTVPMPDDSFIPTVNLF